MDMQNVSNLQIPEGAVRTIHDKDNRLLWGRVAYDVKYAGDIFQQTYSGKNLAKVTECNISTSSYSLVISDGSVDINSITSNNWFDICGGQRTGDWVPTNVASVADYNLTSADEGTYVLSIQNFSYTNTANQNAQIHVITNQRRIGTSITRGATSFEPKVFTLEAGEHVKMIGAWIGATGTGELKGEFQLEAGSQPSPYEPYVGGAPAPNPDYPQNVQTVTGDQTVNVSGKNLFDIQDATGTRGNNTVVASNQTIIVNSNTSGTETAFYLNDCSYISQYLPTSHTNARDFNMTGMGGDYTLKVYYQNIPSGTGTLHTCIYTNKRTILKSRASIVNGAVEATIPLDNDEYIKSAVLYTANTNVFNNFTIKAQLEEGSTATAYEPYQSQPYTISLGSLELCKIDGYQDYIYKSGDDWYTHKAVRKLVVGGTVTWTKSQYGTNTYSINPAQEIAYSDDTENVVLVKSNCFIGVSYADRTVSTNNITYGAQSNTLFIRNTPFDTATELQTFCSNNNPVFYYALKTPTDTQITDVTLIGQLNAVHEWLTRYGYNATVSGNLPLIVDRTNL